MIESVGIGFIFSAFVAGVITFFAPCTLPLVPAYLGFISGVRPEELKDSKQASVSRRKILKNGIFFVLGFSIVFILLGMFAGFIGSLLADIQIWVSRIGGLLIFVFGLMLIGAVKVPFLLAERRLKIPSFVSVGSPAASCLIGAIFAFGWTPCVGPVLGAIFSLAATSTTVFKGAFLLAVFSLGLAIPFLALALAFSKGAEYIGATSRYLPWVSFIGGVFLIAIGMLLMSGNLGILIAWGYALFDFFDYERIEQYL
ncbi:cytochrome c biogenesis protein CcdA [bacterium]|nr:cytochrome c biogenesis protein CcdA [bacterium]